MKRSEDYEFDRYEKILNCRQISHHVSNEYYIEGDYVYVKLRWTKEEKIMVCDIEDWERLKGFTWGVGKAGGYAVTNVVRNKHHSTVKFHQIIMGQKMGYVIDHINRNPIDNRKENLRFVTPQVNLLNKGLQKSNVSGFKGVTWRNDMNKWRAQIWIGGKAINLGNYDKKEDAIAARLEAEEIYHNKLLER